MQRVTVTRRNVKKTGEVSNVGPSISNIQAHVHAQSQMAAAAQVQLVAAQAQLHSVSATHVAPTCVVEPVSTDALSIDIPISSSDHEDTACTPTPTPTPAPAPASAPEPASATASVSVPAPVAVAVAVATAVAVAAEDSTMKTHLTNFFEAESVAVSLSKPWLRLERGIRMQKFRAFADAYPGLTSGEKAALYKVLLTANDSKLLNTKQQINYEMGVIHSVKGLKVIRSADSTQPTVFKIEAGRSTKRHSDGAK